VTSLIDTQDETLLPTPPSSGGTVERRSGWHRVWTLPLLALSLLALLGVAVTSVLPSRLVATKVQDDEVTDAPYALTPRSATPVDDRVSFGELAGDAELDSDREGDVYFVTVSEPTQSVLGWWAAGGDSCNRDLPPNVSRCSALPQIDVLTTRDKYGDRTPTENRSISLQMMRTSSQVAQYVALKKLGYEDATIEPGAVVVGDLVPGAPATAVLQIGDTITSIAGTPVPTVDDLVKALAGKQPGDVVEVAIDRPDSGETTVQVTLMASPDDASRTIVGIVPFDTASVHLPFQVNIDTGRIGGPSAGLAFTLTLIDELSPGDLTGGANVAVTGEIALDGTVGAIGGLAQKVSAVRQAGVPTFIVPTAQGPDQIARAREIGGDDVEIVPVATLDEALVALRTLGGDPLPQ
jgi:PDZ domain-containing protein